MENKKKLSVIVPVFNEEENISMAYTRIKEVLETKCQKYDWEILFLDNRSRDQSFKLIKELASQDNHVRGLRYSRNFGYQRSIYKGYLESRGDAVMQIDCDLQDDPELIPKFLEKWEAGAKIVYGIRKKRKEGFLINTLRMLYYRTVNYLSEDDLPLDVGEFRLLDKVFINHLRGIDDHQPYLRGLVATLGYEAEFIEYERDARERGDSKFTLKQYFQIAFDGISNHSVMPLRLATYFGFGVSVFTTLLSLVYLVGRLVFAQEYPAGFATTTLLTLFAISLNAIFLGIIGEYIGRIYKQLKKRPIAIIDEEV